MGPPQTFRFDYHTGEEAASSLVLVKAVSHIFNNSFGKRPDGTPYRLGNTRTRTRLEKTDHLFTALNQPNGRCGYLFGRLIPFTGGLVAWIDSLAVMPEHRRKGIGTNLVSNFINKVENSRFIACATPNPVAALVITKAVKGTLYVGECNPPQEIISVITQIRPRCPDLQGAKINFAKLLVGTDFTPVSSEATRGWSPPHHSEPPPWWSSLENLPEGHEALLIIDRS